MKRYNEITQDEANNSELFVKCLKDEERVRWLIDELKDPRDQADYYELIVFHLRNASKYELDLSLVVSISDTLQDRAARFGENAYRVSEKQLDALVRAYEMVKEEIFFVDTFSVAE